MSEPQNLFDIGSRRYLSLKPDFTVNHYGRSGHDVVVHDFHHVVNLGQCSVEMILSNDFFNNLTSCLTLAAPRS